MTSPLLAALPSLTSRSAGGGLSSRVGCRVLNRSGANTVPWAARQQMRFASGEGDNYDDDHYATLGVKPTDSIENIKKIGAELRKATHSDHNMGIDNDKFIKINAAVRVLANPEKKAKFDQRVRERKQAAQASASAQQRAADTARAATAARDTKRAREATEAAKAKKRDEERIAADRARRKAQRAEEDRLRKAEEKSRREAERKAAAEAAEEKRVANEAARKKAAAAAEAAAVRRAAAEARDKERERQREREARMVVLRCVPIGARVGHVILSLRQFRPGRILDSGVGEGTAWVEFWTAEQAQALHRAVTETDRCVILGKVIKTAAIYQGRTKVPEGQGFITRCLRITARADFMGGEAALYPLLRRRYRDKGFTTEPATLVEGVTLGGKRLIENYASVADAQKAKAVLEKHYPELSVVYYWDHCEHPRLTALRDAVAGSKDSKKGSRFLPTRGELTFFAVCLAVAIYMDIKRNKSAEEDAQQKEDT